MTQHFLQKFKEHKQSLAEALAVEDYQESGYTELTAVKEAITSVCDDVDIQLLDWLLWYVYSKSEGLDRMEYRCLVRLLDTASQPKQRVQSAKP